MDMGMGAVRSLPLGIRPLERIGHCGVGAATKRDEADDSIGAQIREPQLVDQPGGRHQAVSVGIGDPDSSELAEVLESFCDPTAAGDSDAVRMDRQGRDALRCADVRGAILAVVAHHEHPYRDVDASRGNRQGPQAVCDPLFLVVCRDDHEDLINWRPH